MRCSESGVFGQLIGKSRDMRHQLADRDLFTSVASEGSCSFNRLLSGVRCTKPSLYEAIPVHREGPYHTNPVQL
jgi:hypothetical protein